MSLIKTIDFPPLGDERGSLVALETHKTVPFDVKRIYYILAPNLAFQEAFMRTSIAAGVGLRHGQVPDGAG